MSGVSGARFSSPSPAAASSTSSLDSVALSSAFAAAAVAGQQMAAESHLSTSSSDKGRHPQQQQQQPKRDHEVVLIAVDASLQAEEAFDWYFENLHRPKNEVILLHGIEVDTMPTDATWDETMDIAIAKRKELEAKFKFKMRQKGIIGRFQSEFECPKDYIVEMATKQSSSYIVMGTRGQGKLKRTILGSVSDYVIHHAHCPVVVWKSK